MKENKDNQELKENQFVNEFEELLYDEVEAENNKNKREIDLNIYNYSEKKLEKYKLLNEEDEILLCKEDALNEIKSKKENKEEDIRIKELYNGEDSDSFYYINKKELKKKYLMRTDLNDENEKIYELINNRDEKEMEKLYNEIQMKHPRKIVDGKITRYSFFSWSGFFCCNKPEYISLGQAYFSYFNTLKMLIIFFLIIALVNTPLIKSYSQFDSTYNITDDKSLLKSTLGNTIIRYFKTTSYSFERYAKYHTINLTFECGDDFLEEILVIQRYNGWIISPVSDGPFNEFNNLDCSEYVDINVVREMNYYEFNDYNCKGFRQCIMKFDVYFYGYDFPFILDYYYYGRYDYDYDYLTDVFYYSCKKDTKNNLNEKNTEDKENELKIEIIIITLLTLKKNLKKIKYL